MTPIYQYKGCYIMWTDMGYVVRPPFFPVPTGWYDTLSQVITWIDKR